MERIMEKMDDILGILENLNNEHPKEEFYSQHLQYSEDMWDSLDSIAENNKKSPHHRIKLLIDFLKGIVK